MSTDLPMQPKAPDGTDGRGLGGPVPTFEAVPSGASVGYPPEAGWAPENAGSGGGGAALISRYLAVAGRYKWLFLLIIAIGTAIGYVASKMVTPTYSVQGRLWFDNGGSGPRGPIQEGQLFTGTKGDGVTPWLDLLTSYAVLDEVVVSRRLFLEYEPEHGALFVGFNLKEKFLPGEYRVKASPDRRRLILETLSGNLVEQVAAGDSLGRSVGFAWVPPLKAMQDPGGVAFSVRRPRDRARELANKLGTKSKKDVPFLNVDYKDTNPQRAAATLNAVLDRFVTLAADLKSARLKEFAALFDEQLRVAQENLQSAEIALESFRVNTITKPSETPVESFGPSPGPQKGGNTATAVYLNVKGHYEQFREDRAAIARAMERARTSGLSAAELETIGAVQASSEVRSALNELATKRVNLRTLQYRYTDEYIDVKKLRGEIEVLEKETIPGLLRALMDELARREEQLGASMASASSELRQIPPRVMEESRLSRQVGIADKIYTSLRQRHEEARLAALGSSPDVRIVDRAVAPQRPLKDRRTFVILYGLGGSLAVVVLAIMVLEKLDRRVRFPEEVTSGLRLPILAAIPQLKNVNGNGHSENTTHVIEAFRGLRLTMLQERGPEGCLIAAITSPGSGDGKSFVAVNLAFALADQGYRTLLIDGDIRRGGLHHYVGGTRKPGLTDFLAGNVRRDEVIQSTSYPLLDLLASGKRLQTGPELLGSKALRDLIADVRARYSVVLIDTPPLGAGVDPFILGMAAGNMVLVLRTGLSDLEFTEAKLNSLDRLPVRVVGAILNGVPAGGAYRYYGYISGYETADEEAANEGARLPALS